MITKIEKFTEPYLKKNLPDIKPGDTISVSQKIKEGEKEKTQVFEGIVIAINQKKEIGGTIRIRRIIDGIGVERVFPIHSPNIEKFEIINKGKAKRAKLYYLRKAIGKKAKLRKED